MIIITNYLYAILFQRDMKRFIFFIFFVLVLSGCIGDKAVETGDKVSIDYIATLYNGEVFDTSIEDVAKQNNIFNPDREYKPLQFTVGKGEVVQGIDEGVIGMKIGESKTLIIPPDTLKHNAIPDTVIQTVFGPVKVSFNETSIMITIINLRARP